METIQDKIETEISNIKSGLESSRSDLSRQISDFIATSSEASQEQSRQIENYATNFASLGMLSQCLVFGFCQPGVYILTKAAGWKDVNVKCWDFFFPSMNVSDY